MDWYLILIISNKFVDPLQSEKKTHFFWGILKLFGEDLKNIFVTFN